MAHKDAMRTAANLLMSEAVAPTKTNGAGPHPPFAMDVSPSKRPVAKRKPKAQTKPRVSRRAAASRILSAMETRLDRLAYHRAAAYLLARGLDVETGDTLQKKNQLRVAGKLVQVHGYALDHNNDRTIGHYTALKVDYVLLVCCLMTPEPVYLATRIFRSSPGNSLLPQIKEVSVSTHTNMLTAATPVIDEMVRHLSEKI